MIRLSKLTDYGLVVMMHFAATGKGATRTAKDVAGATTLPLPTVSKLLKILARGDLLLARRGVKGGYQMDRDAQTISLAEMVEVLEGPVALTECVAGEGEDCLARPACPVRGRWGPINEAVISALRHYSLKQLATEVDLGGHATMSPGLDEKRKRGSAKPAAGSARKATARSGK